MVLVSIPPMCDFCSGPDVRWSYPARDFIDLGLASPNRLIVSESVGAWAACDECHRLIEADDREQLLRRSVERFVELYGLLLPGLDEGVRQIQSRFFEHRSGPAVELGTTSDPRR